MHVFFIDTNYIGLIVGGVSRQASTLNDVYGLESELDQIMEMREGVIIQPAVAQMIGKLDNLL